MLNALQKSLEIVPLTIDYTDDWMNPVSSISYTYREPKPSDPVRYLIERKRRVITFGDPLYQWDFWTNCATATERDQKLADLRKLHPNWQLRARDENPWLDFLKNRSKF